MIGACLLAYPEDVLKGGTSRASLLGVRAEREAEQVLRLDAMLVSPTLSFCSAVVPVPSAVLMPRPGALTSIAVTRSLALLSAVPGTTSPCGAGLWTARVLATL
jgi:hypothetical protein